MSPSFAFVLFERDGDGTRARTTNDPRFTRSVPSSSSHSLSLVTSWDDDHHRHHHHLGEQDNDTALSYAAKYGHPKCVELLLRHVTKENVLKKTIVRPLSLAPFVLITRSSLVRLDLRPPLATQSISSYLSMRSLHGRVSQTLSLVLRRNALSLRPPSGSSRLLTSRFSRWSREETPPRSGHRKEAN